MHASLVAQAVKNLPAMQETGVRSLSQEDPMEKGMATHSSILTSRIPWTEEPGRLQSTGVTKSRKRLSKEHFRFPTQAGISSCLLFLVGGSGGGGWVSLGSSILPASSCVTEAESLFS